MSTFKITLGSLKADEDGSTKGCVVVESTEGTVHPDYNNENLANDIAVIKLPESVDTSTGYFSTVRLPRFSDATKKLLPRGFISGWGKIGDNDEPSNELKFLRRKVVDNTKCAKLYGGETITTASLCIKNTDMQGTCQGDSGGPFVIKDKDRKFTQIGLVSFGSSISCVKYPSGFTKLASHLTWISATTDIKIRP